MSFLRFVFITLVTISISACASHKVIETPDLAFSPEARDKAVESNGVYVLAKAIHDKTELKKYFANDLVTLGMLPIQLNIRNKNYDGTLKFHPDGITLTDGNGSNHTPLALTQVYEITKKSYGRTVGWTLAFGAIGAGVSAANVAKTNNKIKADYEGKMIAAESLTKGEDVEGFVFFEIPKDINQLNGWQVSTLLIDSQNSMDVMVQCPLEGTISERKSKEKSNFENNE